jgi:HD-GYP domain-containing protein (c-di-GMP phosphodiesterase class II)
MRTNRPYRAAMSVEAATEQMIVNAGSQFDPAVVEAMLPVVAAAEPSVAAAPSPPAPAATAAVAPEPRPATAPAVAA